MAELKFGFIKSSLMDGSEIFVNYEDVQNWLRTERDSMRKSEGPMSAREKAIVEATLQTLMDALAATRYNLKFSRW